MLGYYLKKWYFDIQTERNEYIFFYCAFGRLLGFDIRAFNINFNRLGNNHIISKSIPIRFPKDLSITNQPSKLDIGVGKIIFNYSAFSVDIISNDVKCNLNFTLPSNNSFIPMAIPGSEKKKINWNPLSLNSRVSGKIEIENDALILNDAQGYIDYLFSTVFPLQAPVHILYWGRIHLAEMDITYTIAIGVPPEQKWCKMFIQMKDSVFEITNLIISTSQVNFSEQLHLTYPSEYEIRGTLHDINIAIQIKHLQEAAHSTFVDHQEMNHKLQSHLTRYLSKNPRGIKFFSQANLQIEITHKKETFNDVLFIDEYVEFSS
jgi:hypothetical protein